MTITHEYRLYEHPLLPWRIVKRGFCWPALIVGPAWLLIKRLWLPTVVLIISVAAAYYLNHNNLTEEMVLNVCGVLSNGQWYAIYNSGITDLDCELRTRNIDVLILILAQVATAYFVNSLWERDLVTRGYTLTKSLRARSLDEARAILARERTGNSTQ
ncbi:MAG: DUF2628 domain-containing protein [Propionivibrio sp.]|nr:DUF2628 domain-containing protein [Propionivibrio sp.]